MSSSNQFGLPLTTPSVQTLIPVASVFNTGLQVHGFIAISSTTFDGTERSYQVEIGTGGSVPITTVTLPTKIQTPNGASEISQFMAAIWDDVDSVTQPWEAYASFVPNEATGYYSRWSTPTGQRVHHFDYGSLLGSFARGMDTYDTYVPPTPVAPTGTDGTLRWVVSLDLASVGPACTFFDFNWVNLFQSSLAAASQEGGSSAVIPLEILTQTNPVGGEFRAAILQRPEYVSGGGTQFSTIRILRMTEEIAAGAYVFDFVIRSTSQGVVLTTPVVLTLTVV